ncbi:uncharacterized protein PHACADRAFT_179428 [Phanerochaete carnosa HHB-10118-sp]|uniref:FAD/NAD(P)-binding domain-containing protein n=1 Tax=Phanerochaete carnosa (strain HHB-10118-sp) TaxID=650164 RepID=K5WF02_PHACS|nr:uncharacterized protein PHACADRAFT_179428 [Phanerochaete carnosa HHB-10118-sp]EKM48752.1 hypothetical protein PHACADRAFT_179428 [Phanerochaete carnosa HHB-10118-sp]
MSKKTDEGKKNVVIVGGGAAGVEVVQQLAKQLDHAQYNLILLNARPYFVHVIAGLRMAVSEAERLEDQVLIPYDRLPATFVQGTLVEIEETAPGKGGVLVLANGDRLEYAALILATGSKWPGLIDYGDSNEEVHENIRIWRERFAQAKNVVIAGGGAVGIELAGEIVDAHPNTKVTIVHSGTRLMNDVYPDKFRKSLEQKVLSRGIALIDRDYVDNFPEALTATDIVTRRGKTIKGADLVIPAFGSRPNTGIINTLGAGVLTEAGYVKVKPTLELPDHPGVFAVGDIVDWNEQKQAFKSGNHASVAVPNLLSFLRGQPQKKVYKGSTEMIVVPIGRSYGAGYFDVLWGITVGNWFTGMIKGKDLLVGMTRKNDAPPS